MIKLKKLTNPWANIAYHINQKKRLEKKEVLAALESDKPIPEYAKPILAAIIRGDYKFKRGLKPNPLQDAGLLQIMMTDWVDDLEQVFKTSDFSDFSDYPDDGIQGLKAIAEEVNKKLRGGRTPREAAKEYVAGLLNISVRSLERFKSRKSLS